MTVGWLPKPSTLHWSLSSASGQDTNVLKSVRGQFIIVEYYVIMDSSFYQDLIREQHFAMACCSGIWLKSRDRTASKLVK